jgi:L-threonylcarbamoyladenylate synthase
MSITTDVDLAVAALATSHLCAIPTETVYGLAANASCTLAVARVFEAKDRPQDHPLIVHVAEVSDVANWIAELPEWANKLAAAVWPGPMTLVGIRTKLALDIVTGGQDTVAVRVPSHPIAHELLIKLHNQGVLGIVAPSANRFGHVSPTTAAHVAADLGEYLDQNDDLILDGGECEVGLESTIVLATGANPVILRPGAITAQDITDITGLQVAEQVSNAPRVSGALDSHYSPIAEVVLISAIELSEVKTSGGLIAAAEIQTPDGLTRLAAPENLAEYAHTLYSALRLGDEKGLQKIFVVQPVGDGLAQAINDRLDRAAF